MSPDKNGEKVDEPKPVEVPPPATLSIGNMDEEKVVTRLSFNDIDAVSDGTTINAPKTVERLEEISTSRALQRRLEEESSDDDDDDRIRIHTDTIDLSGFDVLDNDKSNYVSHDIMLDDIEELV
jgi:hypothetical protein